MSKGLNEKLDKIFLSYEGSSEELIPILQNIQEHVGYLPQEAMQAAARFIRVPESRVYAAASFYAQFRFKPRGKHHIMVCRGTACHVKGADLVLAELEQELGIKEGETSPDREYSLETVACIGACGIAPTIRIDEETYGNVTPQKVKTILKEFNKDG